MTNTQNAELIMRFRECLKHSQDYVTLSQGGSYYCERKNGTLKLFFQWSNGLKDWLHNFDFYVKPYRDMTDTWYCHRGFLKVWKEIEPCVEEQIKDATVKCIEVTGYSHGAAIALLAHEYIKYHRPDVKVSSIGYGCPRVVWGRPSENVLSRFEGFTVVRNENDVVTHLPPMAFGYKHVGMMIEIGEGSGSFKAHLPERYLRSLWTYPEGSEKKANRN